ELHIEQGRALADLDAPVGVATGIWPHGRWRFDFTGVGNHAGTTRMSDRRDPMLTLAFAVLAVTKEARLRAAHAPVGRVRAKPNATNAIAAEAAAWMDVRAADEATLKETFDAIVRRVRERAARDRVEFAVTAESISAAVGFDTGLTAAAGVLPAIATAAG